MPGVVIKKILLFKQVLLCQNQQMKIHLYMEILSSKEKLLQKV